MKISAIIIHPKDTVACLLHDHLAGETIVLETGVSVLLASDIPMGHKVALRSLLKGEPVIKFGAVIGHASEDIQLGEHVHLNNLEGG